MKNSPHPFHDFVVWPQTEPFPHDSPFSLRILIIYPLKAKRLFHSSNEFNQSGDIQVDGIIEGKASVSLKSGKYKELNL
jgi:hypothetical protein